MISSITANHKRLAVGQRLAELGIPTKVAAYIYNAAGVVALRIQPGAGVKAATIMARANDMQMAAGVEHARVTVDHVAGAVVLELSVQPAPILYTSELMGKHVDGVAGRVPYNMTVGKRVDGTELHIDIADPTTPHVLLAGTTGAGKTALWHSMLATVCKATPRLKVLTYDPIHVGIPWIMPDIKANLLDAVSDPAAMVDRLNKLCAFMDAGHMMHGRLLVCIDEVKDLLNVQPEIEGALVRLATRGRNHGIHFLLATQNPSAKVLSADLVACMPVRLVLSVARGVDSRIASGDKITDAHKLPKPGHGMLASGDMVARFVAAIPADYKKGMRPMATGPDPDPAGFNGHVTRAPQHAIAAPAAVVAPVVRPDPPTPGTGFVMPARIQTIEAEASDPAPVAMARPANSYTLAERVALLLAWNPGASMTTIQKALNPGGRANGFYAIQDIVAGLTGAPAAEVAPDPANNSLTTNN